MSSGDEIRRLIAMVEECRDKLAEHFDSVRIFVTFPTNDGESDTGGTTKGGGNFYAQLGQVDEWLEIQREYVRVKAREDSKS